MKTIHKLSQKYGDIMLINLLGKTYWVLNSYEAVKKAFVTKGDIFAARPITEYGLFQLVIDGTVVMAEFEITIHNVLDDVGKYNESQNGDAHDYSRIILNFAFSVMGEMICSKRFAVDSEESLTVQDSMRKIFQL